MNELQILVWLIMVFGAGNSRIWKLLRRYETPQKVYEVLCHPENDPALHLPEYTLRRIRQTRRTQVDEVLERCHKLQISILQYSDAAYPEQLTTLSNPPLLLFYQGDISLLKNHLLLTIVGTRNATEYSLRVEKALCGDLVQLDFVPVTGFAVGIDIAANRCALEAHKPSVALMGCGLDVPYPAPHFQLKRDIAACGLILSEFLPGTSPASANFPLRNRVLAGISMGTLVIQAPVRSGALITAEYAVEQGRDVFCVPPADIFDKRYMGVIKYLRDGAIPVFDCRDVIYEYYTSHAHMISASALFDENYRKSESFVMQLGENSNESRQKRRANAAPIQKAAEPDAGELLLAEDDTELSELQQRVLALIRQQTVMHMDMLAVELDIPMELLTTTLTELELFEKIERLPGKQFRIIG